MFRVCTGANTHTLVHRGAHLGVFPPAKVVSAVVLPHCVTAWVWDRVHWGHGEKTGGGGQSSDAVKLQVTHSHGPEV